MSKVTEIHGDEGDSTPVPLEQLTKPQLIELLLAEQVIRDEAVRKCEEAEDSLRATRQNNMRYADEIKDLRNHVLGSENRLARLNGYLDGVLDMILLQESSDPANWFTRRFG